MGYICLDHETNKANFTLILFQAFQKIKSQEQKITTSKENLQWLQLCSHHIIVRSKSIKLIIIKAHNQQPDSKGTNLQDLNKLEASSSCLNKSFFESFSNIVDGFEHYSNSTESSDNISTESLLPSPVNDVSSPMKSSLQASSTSLLISNLQEDVLTLGRMERDVLMYLGLQVQA